MTGQHLRDPDMALKADLEAEFPGWHVWEHVDGGLFYARRPGWSPCPVAGPVPLPGLRDAIMAVMDGRTRR